MGKATGGLVQHTLQAIWVFGLMEKLVSFSVKVTVIDSVSLKVGGFTEYETVC